jgi:hypothetical protein
MRGLERGSASADEASFISAAVTTTTNPESACGVDNENTHFLSLRNSVTAGFKVGYEPEFKAAGTPSSLLNKRRRSR